MSLKMSLEKKPEIVRRGVDGNYCYRRYDRRWENYHRLWTVRLHMQHIHFRQETRYPGFYYRADFMGLDDSKWKCFVNSKYDVKTGKTHVFKKPYYQIIPTN